MSDAPADVLETTECGRCGGTGRYSYNQISGSRCFGCGGAKRVYTPRGRAAADFLESLRQVPVTSLVPGDLVRHEMMVGLSIVKTFSTVTAVEAKVSRATVNGEPRETPVIEVACENKKHGRAFFTVGPDVTVRKGFDAETKAEQFARAIAFQATLDARGRPLKAAA